MTKQALYSIVLLTLVTVLGAQAADISGKWVAQVPGFGGEPMETAFMFKVSNGAVTGTVSVNFGGQTMDNQISEGKIAGDDLSFVTVVQFPGGEGPGMKIVYKGKVAGSELKFSQSFQGGPGGGDGDFPPIEYTAKKAN
jgi:hypothetical protein